MNRITLLAITAVMASTPGVRGQSLLDSITTPDKAVAVVNQTLEGTWLSEVRPGNLPAGAPPILQWVTFNANGTLFASPSDGTQSVGHGVWVRVGDRKYLVTIFVFVYNEARVLMTITKARVNLQVSPDGKTSKATNEAAIMDRNGRVLATVPGGTATGVRLNPEIPADFYDFQKIQ
jgi:hypothetical protein